jgi:hypothetical protein
MSDGIHVYHKSLADFMFNQYRAGEHYVDGGLCHLDLAYSVQWANETKITFSFPFTPTTPYLKL